jgi:hypothetical protein
MLGTQSVDLAPIGGGARATVEPTADPAPGSETTGAVSPGETARALARLPPEQLRQLEEIEHLIVSIMISREIQRCVGTLVNDNPSELGNLMKALAGFRCEVHREMDRGSIEIYPSTKTSASVLDQVIAEFKAAKGQD